MKTIIFDCDGVLIDSEILYQEIMIEHMNDHGIFYEKPDFIAKFMGTGSGYFYEVMAKEHQKKFERPLPENFTPSLKARLRSEFKIRLQAVSGISDLLSSMDQIMAVASSSENDFLHDKLKQTELHAYFRDHIYSADFVEQAKPFPDLFLYTADKLNVAPSECIVIEDSENGVKAGLAAGMHVIGFCGGLHSDEAYGQKLKQTGAHQIAMNATDLSEMLKAA